MEAATRERDIAATAPGKEYFRLSSASSHALREVLSSMEETETSGVLSELRTKAKRSMLS